MIYSTDMTFEDIPFTPEFEEFSASIKIEQYPGMRDSTRALFEEAVRLIRPKALYKTCYIEERKSSSVLIDGTEFSSSLLRKNLDGIERVFCFVATCGTELEDFSLDPGDLMEQFLLDGLKEMALRRALDYLREGIKEEFQIPNLAMMNPGSADAHVWPIQQQKELFSLLGDVKDAIGVELTDSFLMIPNKTVSGLFFPTEVDFHMCEACTREPCPNRKAAYSGMV